MVSIKVWKSMKLSDEAYKTPFFVIDEKGFFKAVQEHHMEATKRTLKTRIQAIEVSIANIKANDKLSKEAKAEDLKKATDKLTKAKEEYRSFTEATENMVFDISFDPIVINFAVSFGLDKRGFGVAGFNSLYSMTCDYIRDYRFSEEWSDSRKKAFTALKNGYNNLVSVKFPLKDSKMYKGFTPDFRSKDIQLLVDKIGGVIKDTKETKTRTNGKAVNILKKEPAYIAFLDTVFFRYGCEVSTQKVKEVEIIL